MLITPHSLVVAVLLFAGFASPVYMNTGGLAHKDDPLLESAGRPAPIREAGREFGKMHINRLHNYQSQLYVPYIWGEIAYKVLAKTYLGYCKKNNTDYTYDNNTCIYYNLMFYTAHGAYSGSRPAETWSGSSLWANPPYTVYIVYPVLPLDSEALNEPLSDRWVKQRQYRVDSHLGL